MKTFSNNKHFLFIALLLLTFLAGEAAASSLRNIANSTAEGVGFVKQLYEGTTLPPIVVIDENHASRIGQLQQSVMLERLYNNHQLREIGLEGFLKGDKAPNVSWFNERAGGAKERAAKTAVRLLQEGEISAVEFIFLIHPDIKIHPTEISKEYDVTHKGKGWVRRSLLKIAFGKSGGIPKTPEITNCQEKLTLANEEYKKAERENNKNLIEMKAKQVQDALHEFAIAILSSNKKLLDYYTNYYKQVEQISDASLNSFVDLLQAIEQHGIQSGTLTQEYLVGLREEIEFWEGRAKASKRMAESVIQIRPRIMKHPVGAVIGAAHSVDVIELLRAKGHPIIHLRSINNETIDFTANMYERKTNGESVYVDGFMSEIINNITNEKKPKMVINTPWFRAKAEAYLFIDRIVNNVLGGSGPPRIPTNWDGSTFQGDWFSIDPQKIMIVDDDVDAIEITDKTIHALNAENVDKITVSAIERLVDIPFVDREALMKRVSEQIGPGNAEKLRVIILNNVERRRQSAVLLPLATKTKTIWVKATNASANIQTRERETVEDMLIRAIDEKKAEGRRIDEKLSDNDGRIQITEDSVALFGESFSAVEKKAIGAI